MNLGIREVLRSLAAAAVCAVVVSGSPAQASENQIVKIEEDWVLVTGEPDPSSDAPQIAVVFAPGNMDGVHAIFEINHGTQPHFNEGGVQLQVWQGNSLIDNKNHTEDAELAGSNETITFTTRMEVNGGNLRFSVEDGESDTWGSFGGGQLQVDMAATASSLSNYSFLTSVKNTKITFAKHKVTRLARTQARIYFQNGNHVTWPFVYEIHDYDPDSDTAEVSVASGQ